MRGAVGLRCEVGGILRRNRRQLEQAVDDAPNKRQRAIAYYRLGVFHDNNGRERIAIGYYHSALQLGLDASTKAHALAWLASSLFKTGRTHEAQQRSQQALRATHDVELRSF